MTLLLEPRAELARSETEGASRRGVPFSMVSTVRDDPRRCGYFRDTLYTLRVTRKILARLRTAISISRDLGARIEHARSREIDLEVPGQAKVIFA